MRIPHANRHGHIIRVRDGLDQIRGRLDLGAHAELPDHLIGQRGHRIQAIPVDVHQGDGRIAQRRPLQDVCDEPASKHVAACTDDRNLGHGRTSRDVGRWLFRALATSDNSSIAERAVRWQAS